MSKQGFVVLHGKNARPSVARQVHRIHGVALLQRGHDLLEVVELRPQVVHENERRSAADVAVAQREAVGEDAVFQHGSSFQYASESANWPKRSLPRWPSNSRLRWIIVKPTRALGQESATPSCVS